MRLSQRIRLLITSGLMCMMLLVASTGIASAHAKASARPLLLASSAFVNPDTAGCVSETLVGQGFKVAPNNVALVRVVVVKGTATPIFKSSSGPDITEPVNPLGIFVSNEVICGLHSGLQGLAELQLRAMDKASGQLSNGFPVWVA